jgi:hypothetical protein
VRGLARAAWTRQSPSCGLNELERALRVAGVVTVGGGDVGVVAQAQEADGEAAQRRHDAGRVPCPDQGFVFLVGDVADPVKPVVG